VPSDRTRDNEQKLKHRTSETLVYCEGDQAVELVGQGGFGVSLFGDIHKMTGHGPGHPAPDYCA